MGKLYGKACWDVISNGWTTAIHIFGTLINCLRPNMYKIIAFVISLGV